MKLDELAAIRRDLHQIPELGFQEYKTQAYLLNHLLKHPEDRIEIEKWRTGLFVKVKGTAPEQILAYRADMDGLSIREDTGYSFSSIHQNRMHACGHDFHMTIALGIIDHFVRNPVKQDLLFLFQPAEEGRAALNRCLKAICLKSGSRA